MHNSNWLQDVYAEIDRVFEEEHLPCMLELCRYKSIAATGEGIEETAKKVMELLSMIGCRDIHLERYVLSPIVVGYLDADIKDAPTIVMYGMYDVQPPDPVEEWTVPPFGGVIKEMPPYGRCAVVRGIANSKGLLVSFINTVQTIKKVLGFLPVNIMFVVEGEEEMGSRSMIPFVEKHKEELQKTCGIFLNGPRQDEYGKPYTILGNKGIIYMELICRGGAWGGPKTVDLHSMNASWVASPVWHLVNALNSMKDENGYIKIEGFYDDLAELSKTDEILTQKMIKVLDEKMYLEQRLFADKFLGGKAGSDAMRDLLWQPTLNIDGITGGYTGPATKTIIAHEARCKMDIRLVPNMRADDILEKLRKHLDKNGYEDIEINVNQTMAWAKSDPDSLAARAAVKAMENSGYEGGSPWPIYPGTGPACVFTQKGLPYISYGLGQFGRIHAPDEWMTVKGLRENEHSCAAFLYYLTELAKEDEK